ARPALDRAQRSHAVDPSAHPLRCRAMSAQTGVLLVMIGLTIGVISGMVGIGGGVLVIPILMFLFGFSQAKANGTSLGMLLPPLGIFAVLRYHKQHNIDWQFALLMAAGFMVGGWIGGWLVNDVKVPEKY